MIEETGEEVCFSRGRVMYSNGEISISEMGWMEVAGMGEPP